MFYSRFTRAGQSRRVDNPLGCDVMQITLRCNNLCTHRSVYTRSVRSKLFVRNTAKRFVMGGIRASGVERTRYFPLYVTIGNVMREFVSGSKPGKLLRGYATGWYTSTFAQ